MAIDFLKAQYGNIASVISLALAGYAISQTRKANEQSKRAERAEKLLRVRQAVHETILLKANLQEIARIHRLSWGMHCGKLSHNRDLVANGEAWHTIIEVVISSRRLAASLNKSDDLKDAFDRLPPTAVALQLLKNLQQDLELFVTKQNPTYNGASTNVDLSNIIDEFEASTSVHNRSRSK